MHRDAIRGRRPDYRLPHGSEVSHGAGWRFRCRRRRGERHEARAHFAVIRRCARLVIGNRTTAPDAVGVTPVGVRPRSSKRDTNPRILRMPTPLRRLSCPTVGGEESVLRREHRPGARSRARHQKRPRDIGGRGLPAQPRSPLLRQSQVSPTSPVFMPSSRESLTCSQLVNRPVIETRTTRLRGHLGHSHRQLHP